MERKDYLWPNLAEKRIFMLYIELRLWYKVDLLNIPPHKIGKKDKGTKVKIVSMGCRKKNEDIADDKTSRGISQKMCYPENSRTMRPDLRKKEYTCGCIDRPCTGENCEKDQTHACNNQFFLPTVVWDIIQERRDYFLLKKKRAEEL